MIILWTSAQLAAALHCPVPPDIQATGVSIDSRTITAGDLFIALRGDQFDGHSYVTDSLYKHRAAAAIISQPCGDAQPVIQVTDTTHALTLLAEDARKRFDGKTIALTGSVGKTTAKEMLYQALSAYGLTHATQGNLNNHLGLPLTLARQPAAARFAVLEMGMNHAGEITPLSMLAQPDIALITTIAPAHIGNLGSMEAIACAKAEIASGLRTNGIVVLPADSPYFPLLQAECRRRAPTCTIVPFTITNPLPDSISFTHPALIANAHATLAVIQALGLPPQAAIAALAAFKPPAGRGAQHTVTWRNKRFTLIDDSYNANPASMKAALSALVQTPGQRHVALLGDMFELGADSLVYHQEVVAYARQVGVALLLLTGATMQQIAKQSSNETTVATDNPLDCLTTHLRDGDILLVKGSAATGLSRIVKTLLTES